MRPSLRFPLALVRVALLLTLALTTVACGGGSIVFGEAPDYYVNALLGDDTNDGSQAAPFKTITRAMDAAASGSTVHVAPGTYDAIHGEVFPIAIPSSVRLIGDEPNKGAGAIPTIIAGGGLVPASVEANVTAVLLPGSNVSIGGFIIHNTNSVAVWRHTGVLIDRWSVRVSHSTIEHSHGDGIRFLSGAGFGHVYRNVVRDNDVGFNFASGGGLAMRFDQNALRANKYGVVVDAPMIDLGGGASNSLGGNLIAWNTVADLVIQPGRTVDAQNNQWNNVPPSVHTGLDQSLVPAGVDIWRKDASASVDTTGATLSLVVTWVPPYLPIGP